MSITYAFALALPSRISGTPTANGAHTVTVSASNASQTTSTDFVWRIGGDTAAPGDPVRYAKLEALSEYWNNGYVNIAELNLLDAAGTPLPRSGWSISADATEGTQTAGRAIDGNVSTAWFSPYRTPSALPHSVVVDLGAPQRLSGLRYQAQFGSSGAIARYRIVLSNDGTNWGAPVAEGNFADLGPYSDLKTVLFAPAAAANRAPTVSAPAVSTLVVGQPVTLRINAGDPDGDALTYSAAGLPTGLAIGASSGTITGTASASGVFNASVTVDDGRGGRASSAFAWTVVPAEIGPISVTPIASGGSASYTAPDNGVPGNQYRWDFGDGSAPTAYTTSLTTSHVYASPGAYTVTLTVRAADGSSVTRSFLQAVVAPALAGRPAASSLLALEGPRLWVVNPDNDSVSVFDTATQARLGEVAVGSQPRSVAADGSGRVWVVNKGSATVSVIDAASRALVQTIALPRASQPYGVVFSPAGNAYVALEATGRVLRLTGSGSVAASVEVGANPRHLALSAAGDRLLVSRFISAPLPGEGSASVRSTDAAGNLAGGELRVLDAATLALQRTIVLRVSDKTDSTVQARGLPNYLGAAAIAPDGRSAWVPGKQDNVQRGTRRDGRNLDFESTLRAISSRVNLQTLAEDYPARADHDNAGLAGAAAHAPNGAYLFVALETSRQVAVLDAARGQELFRVDTGRAPQALLASADGRRLYLHNFMDRSVGVYDLRPLVERGEAVLPVLATLASVGSEKLAANVLAGKRLFYDARDQRLARDAYISCAACHNDGGHDGRTWDFSGFGEGLRNTPSLRGRAGAQGFLHWSANFDEVQDFEGQIRTLAQGSGLMSDAQFNSGTRGQPLGDRKAGVSADLDALAAYVASLSTFAPTPYRNADATLSAAAQAGRSVFTAKNCATCHGGAAFTIASNASSLRDVGTIKPTSGSRLSGTLSGIDIPTLRDAWAGAPYLHDGSAATLADAVQAHTTLGISAADAASVAAYVREIGSEEASAPAAPPAGGGLRGEYYSNTAFGGTPALVRTEAVDFDWGSGGAPAGGVAADNFSVRWSGTLEAPTSGWHYLMTFSDERVRVWFEGQLVIDNWSPHTGLYDTTTGFRLQAGQRRAVRVEYQDNTGTAKMRLYWYFPGATGWQIIPAARLSPN